MVSSAVDSLITQLPSKERPALNKEEKDQVSRCLSTNSFFLCSRNDSEQLLSMKAQLCTCRSANISTKAFVVNAYTAAVLLCSLEDVYMYLWKTMKKSWV